MTFDFNSHTHRRLNPLLNSYVMVAPHRTQRPWNGEEESPVKDELPAYDPQCYLCPRNKRAKGNVNPNYTTTFIFENDYAAVKEDQPDLPFTPVDEEEIKSGGSFSSAKLGTDFCVDKSSLLLRTQGVTGVAYVICFNPSHNMYFHPLATFKLILARTLANMSPKLIIPILETWTKLYISLQSSPYSYAQIFENKGAAVGCSNPHPHCQVWTTSHIPHEPLQECHSLHQYRQKYNSCMLCDYAALEIQKQQRVISQRGIWIAVVPYWAIWPFEVLLLSTRHVPSLPELSEEEIVDLAEILSIITIRYDNLFECSFPLFDGDTSSTSTNSC